MNALVTGATGFLGSHLCRRLAAEGYGLTILCRQASRLNVLEGLQFRKVVGDITDLESVEKAVAGNDVVFHAAAHGMYWGGERELQRDINIGGTRNIVEACLKDGVTRLVYVSSISAVGIPESSDSPADENFRFNLSNGSLGYHRSKRSAEEIVLSAAGRGLDTVAVNPSSIWGPYRGRYRLEEFARKVRQTKLVPYFAGGICPVHVEDVVDGIIKAAECGRRGERYILGGENVSYKAIAEMAAEKQGLERVFVRVPKVVSWTAAAILESSASVTHRRPRISFATHYCSSRFNYYDSTKARQELAFSPRPFGAIMDECLAFLFSQNGNRKLHSA